MNFVAGHKRLSTRTFAFPLVLIVISVQAFAAVELFEVDAAATSLTLQGSTGDAAWQEQGPGGLTTTCQGWLVADLGASSIQFIVGSSLVAEETNSWQPGVHGSTTPEPANYGGRTTIGSGISSINEVAAVRNLAFDISSAPIPTESGQFDSSGLTLAVAPTPNATLDYRDNGLVVTAGSRPLGGLSASNAAGAATLSLLVEVQTLTVPVDLSLPAQAIPAGETNLRLTGQVVARRGVMILKPQLLWIASPTNRSQFTLVWSSPYRLQKATALSPADWTDFAADAPATITLNGASGFFRVVAGG